MKMKDSIIANVLTEEKKTISFGPNLLRSDFCPCCGHSQYGDEILFARKEEEREKWFCDQCHEEGEAVDFIVALKGISLNEALKQIRSESNTNIRFNKSFDQERQNAIEHVISIFQERLPKFEQTGIQHLMELGLTDAVLFKASQKSLFGFLPGGHDWKANQQWLEDNIGIELMIKAGLQNPEKQLSGLAFRSIIFFLPKAKAFEAYSINAKPGTPRTLRYGMTAAPYWWNNGLIKHNEVWVVSGVIEMLSAMQSNPTATIVGLPGDKNGWKPDWIGALKKIGADLQLVCAFKNDKAGETAASKLETFCSGADIPYLRKHPSSQSWTQSLLAN